MVLDCGSYNVNGDNRTLFKDCNYTGIDVTEGRNVDVVCRTKDLKTDKLFDTIISTNAFEHDKEYEESLKNIVTLLKPKALFVFSCSAPPTPPHGTLTASPRSSLTLKIGWDYYKNLVEKDIRDAIDIDKNFHPYEFKLLERGGEWAKDLQFWGIKT
jgi:SAM-dependent methyltransferase